MKISKKTAAVAALLLLCAVVAVLLFGRRPARQSVAPTTLEDLATARIGIVSGARSELTLRERLPNATIEHLQSDTDGAVALKTGRVDAFVASLTAARTLMGAETGYRYLDDPITTNNYAILLQQGDTALETQMNEVLLQLKEEGVLTALQNKWLGGAYEQGKGAYTGAVPEIAFRADDELPADAEPLRVMTGCDNEPFSFYDADHNPTGYDVELMRLVAQRLGRPVQFTVCGMSAILPAMADGLADAAVNGIVENSERAERYTFTTPIYSDPNLAVVLDESTTVHLGFWQSLQRDFTATFITENRGRMIADGLVVTLFISLLAGVLGTALGFAASYPLRSANRRLRGCSAAVSALLAGTPLVVILMVMYYLVFVGMPPLLAAVLGFTLDFGNSVANLLNAGIATISRGEQESALALGYNKRQIFLRVTLPQAVQRVFPQYRSALTGMVKGTSIVGYIMVQDLTKVTDIIRSRTYAAFFPLILTAVLYFLITELLTMVLRRVAYRLEPKNRPRSVEGVREHD